MHFTWDCGAGRAAHGALRWLKTDFTCLQITEAMRLLDADPEAGQDPIPTSIVSDFGLVQWREVCHPIPCQQNRICKSMISNLTRHRLRGVFIKSISSLLSLFPRQALRAVHYPASMVVAEAGRRRLAFDELFLLQLKLLLKRALQR